MPRYENDLPDSDIKAINTFPVSTYPDHSMIMIQYSDQRTEDLKGAKLSNLL